MDSEAERPGERSGRADVRAREAARVSKRHVLYIHGYDPRGVRPYRRLFEEQYRHFCQMNGLEGKLGEPEVSGFVTAWTATTSGVGWRVETSYEYLGWEDVIRPEFSAPAPVKVFRAIRSLITRMVDGTLGAVVRTRTRFRFFFLYPFFLLLLEIAVAAGVAYALASLGDIAGMRAFVGAGIFALALALLLRLTERRTYLLYLLALHAASLRYARRAAVEWDRRFEAFAGHIEKVVRTTDADEVVLIGHSLGAVAAVDCIARALVGNASLGSTGPRVVLCTLGGNVPVVGLDPAGGWLRKKIQRLAGERSIRWIDFHSSRDVVGFGPFDPVSGHGIEVAGGRANPVIVRVSFKDSILPENYAKFRLGFFGIHFQFLKASQRQDGPYDYVRLCCGPVPFEEQALRLG